MYLSVPITSRTSGPVLPLPKNATASESRRMCETSWGWRRASTGTAVTPQETMPR